MKDKFIDILVCPKCGGKLSYDRKENELICNNDMIAFQILDGIPIMLCDQARSIQNIKHD
ncbi:hypothetical protein CONE_0511 [Candidatus Kinetoplastibacterium oncopeltii TCC290E]|uniref:UPF0434 protein CONE_0511 n=1 Tax=Candidatus Kinetoplastidibacterium stringomonadis TCC290E TaxID=1208920 RepID=M1L6U1_9PROT|nr:Trm112 family protein [Candidatus Kinetoplastibacterium oncopeltii]AGF48288.1 hypothetical protein CONE_0511 [Candidatus Kinetoplastibacterium oncopeltii TCC290E]